MYDKFYWLAGEICLLHPFTAQVQRGIGNQTAKLSLVQNAASLHEDLRTLTAPKRFWQRLTDR